MAHNVETMAFAHETPWHKLGVRVGADTTPDQMLIAAGLDWEVEKRKLYTAGADGAPIEVIRRKALVRKTDDRVFDVVGNDWNPVQNAKVLEFFHHFCRDGGATMETAGALEGGRTVWALANLGDGFVLPGGDAVKGYLLLASRHQSGFSTIARVTPIRVVCANTFAMSGGFIGASNLRIPHSMEFEPKQAAEQMGLARHGLHEFETCAQKLQEVSFTQDEAVRLLAPIYQAQAKTIAERDELVADFDRLANRPMRSIFEGARKSPGTYLTPRDADGGINAWALFNGITYWANHGARGTADSRLTSTLVGQNAANANRAFSALMKAAG